MTILERYPWGWILSHEQYVNTLYSSCGYRIRPIFDIFTPFRMDLEAQNLANHKLSKGRRRRKNRQMEHPEPVLRAISSLSNNPHFLPLPVTSDVIRDNNKKVRTLIRNLEEEQETDENSIILPPSTTRYVIGDIREIKVKISGKFDLILMDPPWENKHVKRSFSGYEMMSKTREMLDSIPIRDLLRASGYLLIWCTTSSRHSNSVRDWIQSQGMSLLSTFYWLKVTLHGEPVTSLDKEHKIPYELLFIVSYPSRPSIPSKVIVSTPSAIHSHKPPLVEILKDLKMPYRDQCLEIFGRYCLPGWTTFGHQSAKFQNVKYFDKLS